MRDKVSRTSEAKHHPQEARTLRALSSPAPAFEPTALLARGPQAAWQELTSRVFFPRDPTHTGEAAALQGPLLSKPR